MFPIVLGASGIVLMTVMLVCSFIELGRPKTAREFMAVTFIVFVWAMTVFMLCDFIERHLRWGSF